MRLLEKVRWRGSWSRSLRFLRCGRGGLNRGRICQERTTTTNVWWCNCEAGKTINVILSLSLLINWVVILHDIFGTVVINPWLQVKYAMVVLHKLAWHYSISHTQYVCVAIWWFKIHFTHHVQMYIQKKNGNTKPYYLWLFVDEKEGFLFQLTQRLKERRDDGGGEWHSNCQ